MRRDLPSWLSPRRLVAALAGIVLIAGLGWAAFAPLPAMAHDQLFEIPPGTSARHMAGEKIDILPQTIRLTLGLNDVLLLKNSDSAPHIFGPTLIMPGQSFSLPFALASTYSFQCTAHATGQLSVIVDPFPAVGWPRLQWRWHRLVGDRPAYGDA